MSAHNFFLALIGLCGTYINSFLDIIFASPFFIPFCIVVCSGFVMLAYKFIRG